MQRFVQTWFFTNCMLLAATAAHAAGVVTLVQDGSARAAIYAPPEIMGADKPEVTIYSPYLQQNLEQRRQRLRESVNDLALYLGKMSGAKVPVYQRTPVAADKVLPILIGTYAEQRFGKVAPSPFKQGWRIAASAKAVGLLGETGEGASYATYELLDRLGARWFMPGEMGEVVPSLKTISVPEMDVTGTPGTTSRTIWYADESYKRRNRLGGFNVASTHALMTYLSPDQLAAHPEWNAEREGKRDIASGFLCEGNPEVASAVADSIIAQLDKNYSPSVSLSPNDGIGFCQCKKWCKPLDAGDFDPSMKTESITDRYVVFCNRVAEKVTKKYPDVQFGFLAYVQYTRPPVREKLHPNLVPVIAPITYCRAHAMTDACASRAQLKPIVEGWGKAATRVAYYNYMYNLAEVSVPYPMIHQMSAELPLLYRNNVRFWQPETLPNFESVLPGLWLSLRTAWNPKAAPQTVLDDFFTKFYGGAEKPMRRYWQVFDDAWSKTPEHAGSGFGHWRRFPPAVLAEARAAMNEALQAARTPMEYRRVKMHDESLRQFERFMQLRWDLNEGRLAGLEQDCVKWQGAQLALADEYVKDLAFDKVGWTPYTIAGEYFKGFFEPAYLDATRMAKANTPLSKAVREWKYRAEEKDGGEGLGWAKAEFADAAWKTTDSGIDSWSTLGLDDYYGTVWYRANVPVGAVTAGKKLALWISGTEGPVKVFVNGQAVPFVNEKGLREASANGFCKPFSFDVTAALKANATNQVTLAVTRLALNEVGTGGLLGPVYLFQQK